MANVYPSLNTQSPLWIKTWAENHWCSVQGDSTFIGEELPLPGLLTEFTNEYFPGGASGKESACNAGDARDKDLIPVSGRSPGEGNGNSLWYSWLENPMEREAWQATIHGVAESHWLSIPTVSTAWEGMADCWHTGTLAATASCRICCMLPWSTN